MPPPDEGGGEGVSPGRWFFQRFEYRLLHPSALQLPRTEPDRVLRVGEKTNAGRLAGAVAKQVRQFGQAVLGVLSTSSMYQAINAVMRAEGYIRKDDGSQDLELHWFASMAPKTAAAGALEDGSASAQALRLTCL